MRRGRADVSRMVFFAFDLISQELQVRECRAAATVRAAHQAEITERDSALGKKREELARIVESSGARDAGHGARSHQLPLLSRASAWFPEGCYV